MKTAVILGAGTSGREGEDELRAVVVGDVGVLADPLLQASVGNAEFGRDTVRWLIGDEDIAGKVNSEEDVKIQHTRDEDLFWFWGTIVGVPLLVLGLGLISVRLRRKS